MRQFIKKLALGMLFLQSCTTTEVIGVGLEYGHRRAGFPEIECNLKWSNESFYNSLIIKRFIIAYSKMRHEFYEFSRMLVSAFVKIRKIRVPFTT